MTSLIQRLRRKTTSGNWIPEIDGLRFIAIAWVVLYHCQAQLSHHEAPPRTPGYAWLQHMVMLGHRGVPLFFVLSGYVLARPFAAHHLFDKARPSLKKYYLRRVTRLEPPYIFNLLVSAAMQVTLQHEALRKVVLHLLAGLVYLHWLFFPHPTFNVNFVAWSLEIEVQFYILAPLLAMVFVIRRAELRRLAMIACMIGFAAAQTIFQLGTLTLLGQIQYFIAGFLFADLAMTVLPRHGHRWQWDLVCIAGGAILFCIDGSYVSYWLPFLIVLLYVAALRGRMIYAFLRQPWVAILGGACYTIYLWHPGIIAAVQRILSRVAPYMPTSYGLYLLASTSIKVAAVLLVCMALYVLIERPCMDPQWPRKLRNWLRREDALQLLETEGS